MFTRSCPSPDQLLHWLNGDLDAHQEIELHIEACASCQDQLERMTSCAMATVTLVPLSAGLQKIAQTPPLLSNLDRKIQTLDNECTPHETAFPALRGYQFISLLGKGGMGQVYLANHLELDRLVAVKVLRADLAMQPNFVSRLRREAKALAALKHPNVLQVFDVVTENGIPALILEYLPDGNLKQRRESRLISPAEACQFMLQVLQGVQAIHQQGIVHRDLKPSNILLNGSVPKVADFGLAYMATSNEQLTAMDEVFGTPEYMAPEQIRFGVQQSSVQSDIYSLGALLYELLSGRPPLVGKSAFQTMELVVHKTPDPLRTIRPEIPRALEQICIRALQKSPELRFSTAQEMAESLQVFLQTGRLSEPQAQHEGWPVLRIWKRFSWPVRSALLSAGLLSAVLLFWKRESLFATRPAAATVAPDAISPIDASTLEQLPAGSLWQGSFTFLPAAEGEVHGDAELEIDSRQGQSFTGTYYSEQRGYAWRVQGELQGNEINWEYVSAIRDNAAANVVGAVKVRGTITGDLLNCVWSQGDERARLTLQRSSIPASRVAVP